MRIIIEGTKYDFVEALAGAELGNLLKLKVKTKTAEFKGTTVKTIQDTFTRMGQTARADDFDPLEWLGDEDFLRAMIGVIYLSRRKAGEQLEVEDAARVSFQDFSIEDDEDDEPGDDSPKAEDATQLV